MHEAPPRTPPPPEYRVFSTRLCPHLPSSGLHSRKRVPSTPRPRQLQGATRAESTYHRVHPERTYGGRTGLLVTTVTARPRCSSVHTSDHIRAGHPAPGRLCEGPVARLGFGPAWTARCVPVRRLAWGVTDLWRRPDWRGRGRPTRALLRVRVPRFPSVADRRRACEKLRARLVKCSRLRTRRRLPVLSRRHQRYS